ncbi:MAG: signal peptide peptidase SppA [bacterium]
MTLFIKNISTAFRQTTFVALFPTFLTWLIFYFIIFVPISLSATSSTLYDALKQGLNTRAHTMGQSFTAIADNGSGLSYNPAGISRLDFGLDFQHIDVQHAVYERASTYSLKLPPLALNIDSYHSSSDVFARVSALNFGSVKPRSISWGFRYKYIESSDKDGWSSDIGLLLHTYPFMDIGLVAKDFINTVDIDSTFAIGSAFFTPQKRFIFASDLIYDSSSLRGSSYDLTVGIEFHVLQELALRAGYGQHHSRLGFGFLFPFGSLDYGVKFLSNEEQHMLGIQIGLPRSFRPKFYQTLTRPSHYTFIELGQGSLSQGKSEKSLLGGNKLGSNDLLSLIHTSSLDPFCEGYVIKLHSLSSDLASLSLLQELRLELEKAKKNGKKIYVYITHWATMPDYYLASIADHIVIPELGTLSHLGLTLDIKKTKAFLNKFGIQPIVLSQGAYKTSSSPHTDPLEDYEKSFLEDLLQTMYMQLAEDIQSSRHITWQSIHHYFDGQLITASQAKKIGLVDHLAYWPDLKHVVNKNGDDIRLVPIEAYLPPPQARPLLDFSDYIAVIEIDGFIQQGPNTTNFLFGQNATGSDDFDEMIDSLIKNAHIKGLIVRINSGGGSMMASDQIYQALQKFRSSGRPVYSSMGNLAASGGYYVALGSDKIFANSSTLTGSIGVMSSFLNFQELYERLGISHDQLKTGKFMDLFSSNHLPSEEHLQMIKAHQQKHYDFFSARVMKDRHLTDDEAFFVSQGQLFTGKQAKKLKLIDEVGNFQDTIQTLATKLSINPKNLLFIRKKAKQHFSLMDILSLF